MFSIPRRNHCKDSAQNLIHENPDQSDENHAHDHHVRLHQASGIAHAVADTGQRSNQFRSDNCHPRNPQPQFQSYQNLRQCCPGFDDYPLLENGKLAYDKGYLEEELNAAGYTLDLVTFQEAGPAINEAYASGELDMAFYGDYPAATAYSNGVDIRVIGVADKQMNAGVLAQKDAGIQSPKDLEGKKVIIGIGTNYQEYWKHLVDTYDIDESKVEIVNVVSDAASVFTTGEADAWLTLYYNVVYYENQGLGVDVENSVAHPEMASLWTVTGRNDFLQENPDAAVAVLKALQRAKEETVSNPDEFFHAIASPTLGVDVFRKAYGFDDTFAFLDSDIDSGVIDKLNYLSDFMLENGYISKAIDVDSFVDTSYYEKLKTSEQ